MKIQLSRVLLATVGMMLLGCTQGAYLRQSVDRQEPELSATELVQLTHHRVDAPFVSVFDVLLDLLQSTGCLVESVDKAAGVVVAQQLYSDGSALLPSVGEIRRMSFRLTPEGDSTRLKLTVFVSFQRYNNDHFGSYYREERGMTTDSSIYQQWFGLIDKAVLRHPDGQLGEE